MGPDTTIAARTACDKSCKMIQRHGILPKHWRENHRAKGFSSPAPGPVAIAPQVPVHVVFLRVSEQPGKCGGKRYVSMSALAKLLESLRKDRISGDGAAVLKNRMVPRLVPRPAPRMRATARRCWPSPASGENHDLPACLVLFHASMGFHDLVQVKDSAHLNRKSA
jgi:hypothetical protein